REQEAMHTTWPDLNPNRGVVTVRYKREFGFSPKAYKGREIPIPNKLVKALKKWKAKSDPGCSLLFSTAGGKPKLDFLDACKMVAQRARLNPDDFWLHKFRATFATWALWVFGACEKLPIPANRDYPATLRRGGSGTVAG